MSRFYDPVPQPDDNAGASLAGAQLFFYENETTTDRDTYSDPALTTENANPVVADGNGRFGDIFLGPGSYTVVLQTASGEQLWSRDDVSGDNPLIVSSYAALRALTGMSTGDLARVSSGTGIDGVFRYDSAQSATDNGGTIIEGWVRIYSGGLFVDWFGADGVTDDVADIRAAFAAGQGGEIIFSDITYLISSAPTSNVYFEITSDNTKISAATASFNMDFDFVTDNDISDLFLINGASNIIIDAINATATEAKSQYLKGYNVIRVINSCSNIDIGEISATNSASGFVANDTTNYATSGFNSTTRANNINISLMNISNDVLSTGGYGIELQCSGDNFSVEQLKCQNVRRPIIAYGVDGMRANVECTDNVGSLTLGGFGSVLNAEIAAKFNGVDTTSAAADIFDIVGYEDGFVNGGSLDVLNGREHKMHNIYVNMYVDVADRAIGAVIGKIDSVGTNDNDFSFRNIKVSGFANGISTGVRIARGSVTYPNSLYTNTIFSDIVVEDFDALQVSNLIRTTSGFQNSPVFQRVVVRHIFCSYTTSNIEYPVIIRDSYVFGSAVDTGFQDVYLQIENSHINASEGSSSPMQPYDKVLINTKLGGAAAISKKRFDIYGLSPNTSDAIYDPNPNFSKSFLVGGVFFDNGSSATNITADLTAGASASKAASTTSYNIDHSSFTPVNDLVTANTKHFKVYCRDSSTNRAMYTGHICGYGDATSDFTTPVWVLAGAQVTNISGTKFLISDLTFSAPSANVLRFTMAASARILQVEITDD